MVSSRELIQTGRRVGVAMECFLEEEGSKSGSDGLVGLEGGTD